MQYDAVCILYTCKYKKNSSPSSALDVHAFFWGPVVSNLRFQHEVFSMQSTHELLGGMDHFLAPAALAGHEVTLAVAEHDS